MNQHTHRFVESYQGPVGFGLSRETDEASLIVYLQKFSDDRLMDAIRTRLSDQEIGQIADLIADLLRRHLTHDEYHRLFIRDEEDEPI
jgi:hypothetical protein